KTVGLVPPATRAARLDEMFEIADFTAQMNCDTVALHLGFVPHDTSDAQYPQIVDVTRKLCDHCATHNQFLHLETGQESADGLLQFIQQTDRENLKVNFDPANMILYGAGKPLDALRKIGPHVRSVHCKDGTWSDQPGVTWGAEVPLGEGDVDIPAYLNVLNEIGYDGPLTIEREIPQEPAKQIKQIGAAVNLLEQLGGSLQA
ncbi:MAG: sugar phosphate isomerase/epimerase family protein, partial [Planctomycetota bacterium]